MTPLTRKTPRAPGSKTRRWRPGTRRNTGDHFAWLLPAKPGWLSDWILKLFYSGVAIDKEQVAILQQLDKSAVVVYVHKFNSNFEYLFYYKRYRQLRLPCPRVGLNYRIFLWQPLLRIVKFFLFRLNFVLRHQALPDPFDRGDIKQQLVDGRCGFLSLVGKKSFYRWFIKANTDPLGYLIDIQKSIDRPVYLVPQLMFFGKAARREHPTVIDILFGPEDKPGRARRLFTLFKKPGTVFAEISKPVSLQRYLRSDEIRDRSTQYQALKLRRDLLRQLNRHRQSITGPVRKSKDELKESILTGERFRKFMDTYAHNREMPLQQVHRKADAYLEEIAANSKPAFIKIASVLIRWIANNMFDGVTTNQEVLNRVKTKSLKGPLVLIPCHKSHIDYLILSYILYHNNMQVPKVAAGKNLAFWPIGPLFRSGGAFFLRRSFRGAVLYARVFAEYVHKLLEEGHSIEQFIEGGRSRTGKLLMPKLGLLSILMNAYKNGACDDMILVPVYVGYDRILEEKSYLHELDGGQKEKENVFQLLRARKFLKKRYGKIYIQFHEPLSVKQLVSRCDPPLAQMESKQLNALVRNLGYRLINAINEVTVVTPHALVAAAILNYPQESFSFRQLLEIIEIYLNHLSLLEVKLADTIVAGPQRAFEQVLDSYCQRKFIEPNGPDKKNKTVADTYRANENRRAYLEYYKNNCIAFFVPAAYTVMAILEKKALRFCTTDLQTGYDFWQNFFTYEFAYDVDRESKFYVRKSIKSFIDASMLAPHPTRPDTYEISPGGLERLRLFAYFLKTYFESYWIVINDFMRNPESAISAKDRLKKISARGNRMYKRGEILRKEALSKINYQNAVNFFLSSGIKGSDDTEKIEFYAAAIQNALKHLRP